MKSIVLTIAFVILGVLAIFSPYWVIKQHRALRTFLPVDATIVSSQVVPEDGGKYFRPQIRYTYSLSGQFFESFRLYPLNGQDGARGTNRDEADGLVRRYPVGSKATAYYDPANPAQSFLLRAAEFFPYMGLIYLDIFLAGAASWLSSRLVYGTAGQEDPEASKGAFQGVGQHAFFMTFLVLLAGTAAHYLWLAPPPYDLGGCAILCFGGAIMLVLWPMRILRQRREAREK